MQFGRYFGSVNYTATPILENNDGPIGVPWCPRNTMSPLPRPTPRQMSTRSAEWFAQGTPASQTEGETVSDDIESRLVWVQNVITLADCDYKVEKTRHFCRFHWMLESSKAFSFRGALPP